jgi:immune inhibitor A
LYDAEKKENAIVLNGFVRTQNEHIQNKTQNYWVQLRSHNKNDQGLKSIGYNPGLVVWFADYNYNNHIGSHPAHAWLSVIDADQHHIQNKPIFLQLRDAAFSLKRQLPNSADHHLENNPLFSDSVPYLSDAYPYEGLLLPQHGIKIRIIEQAYDNASAIIEISREKSKASFSMSHKKGRKYAFQNKVVQMKKGTYLWDFGDSTHSRDSHPEHTYAEDGTYLIKLTTSDVLGNKHSTTQHITINTAPIIQFQYKITNKTILLVNHSKSALGELTYFWDFGDGESSTEASPQHTFKKAISTQVQLTITDKEKRSATKTIALNASAIYEAKFDFVQKGNDVFFKNRSKGEKDFIYLWDFGDQTSTLSSLSPKHTYPLKGTYLVSLIMIGKNNVFLKYTQSITVLLNEDNKVIQKEAQTNPIPLSNKTSKQALKKGGGSWDYYSLFLLIMLLSFRRKKV